MAERTGKNAVTSFRNKYPGKYDNYSDKEMLDAIKRKYPKKYEDLTIEESLPKSEGIFQRALKGVGTQAMKMITPNQDQGLMKFAGPTGLPWQKQANDPGGMMDVIGGASGEVISDMANVKDPLARGIIGAVADPRTYVGGGKLTQMAGGKAIEGAKKGAGWFAKPWQKVSEIDKFKSSGMSDIAQEALQKEAQIFKSGGLRKQVSNKLYGDEPLRGVESQTSYLEKSIPKATHQESLRLQKDLPVLYGRKSREFGNKLSELVGDRPVEVPVSEIQPALKQSLLEHGILKFDETGNMIPARAPISKNETKLFNMYRNFEEGLFENPEIVTDASDLIKTQSAMKIPFGKAFKGDDMLMNTVKKNISGVIEKYVPGVKELRSSHAPFIQGKYASIKELSPFSGQFSTKKASGFLQKYASGLPESKGGLSSSEKSLVGFLEKELGRTLVPEGKAMGGRLGQMASKQKAVKDNMKQILSDIDKSVDDAVTTIKSQRITDEKQIQEVVDQMIRKNNLDKWKRKGIAIGVGSVAGNAILSRVTNWLFGKPSDS